MVTMIQTTQMHKFFGLMYLIFITGVASFTNEDVSTESHYITPIEYFIEITTNIQNNSFLVTSAALVNVTRTLPIINLNTKPYCDMIYNISYISDNLTCTHCAAHLSLLVKEQFSLDIPSDIDVLKREDHTFILNKWEKDILPGMYWISAKYNCSLDRVVTFFAYADESEAEKFLILPHIPAEWIFPYSKTPASMAKFTIRIKHKDTETAISHMPVRLLSKQTNIYSVFNTTHAMSTHMLAAVVIPNEILETNDTLLNKVTIRSRRQVINSTSYVRSVITNVTRMIRNKWKDTIQSHVHYVTLPLTSSQYESIITTGLVLFREADIVFGREINSIMKRIEVTCLVARSVMQEIFSNWLTTQSDLWFIEGFTTYYGAYIVDQTSDEPFLKSIVIQTRREYLDYIETFVTYDVFFKHELETQNPTLRKLWKVKIFALIDMLAVLFSTSTPIHEIIMEEALNVYYSNHKQLTLDDIWTKVQFDEKWWGNITHLKTLNVKDVITPWTTQVGYPVAQVERDSDRCLVINVIDCNEFSRGEPCEHKWLIPMAYITIHNNSVLGETYLRPRRNIEIHLLTKEDFIIVVKQTGYRVNYNRQTWKNIAVCLKTIQPEYLDIYDINFAQLLDDAFYFLVQNPIYNAYVTDTDIDIYLELASNLLQRKSSYIEWYPMLTALQHMSKIFPFSGSAHIKDKILKILHTFLENTAHEHSSENSVSNELYHEVIKWTCILDDVKCKKYVNAILEWHRVNPVKNKLLPNWQKWIYCQGLMGENATCEKSYLWLIIENILQLKETVQYLPCSKVDTNILESLLAVEHYQNTPHLGFCIKNEMKNVSKVTYLFDLLAKHSKNVASLHIIITGLRLEMSRNCSTNVNLLAVVNFVINNVYSYEGLSEITSGWVLVKLLDMYGKYKVQYLLEGIREKRNSRLEFLLKMQENIPSKIYNVLKY